LPPLIQLIFDKFFDIAPVQRFNMRISERNIDDPLSVHIRSAINPDDILRVE